MRYEIVQVSTVRRPVWTVVEHDGDKCNGGDHHWLEEIHAQRAMAAYEAGVAKHGDPPMKVQSVGAGMEP